MGDNSTQLTERLLALILLQQMSDASDREKIAMLSFAGMDHASIAELLGKTSQAVRQAVYEHRKFGEKPAAAKAKRAKPSKVRSAKSIGGKRPKTTVKK